MAGTNLYSREATIVVAAANSKDSSSADYVCDGTDDQKEIQSAIDALPSSGGRVLLLEGTYNISAAINILHDNITLAGQGNGTKLFLVNGANCSVIQVGNGSKALEGVTVRDLQIDGNKANQTAGYGIYFYGGSGAKITESTIKNCRVKNCHSNGIYLNYSNNNIITGNISLNNWGGVNLLYANNNTITGNQANSNSYDGFYLLYANNNTITGNQANSNTIGIGLAFANNNTITGNQANSNRNYGISLSSSNNNTIIGNQANSNIPYGMFLYTSDYNTIVGNRCQGNIHYGIDIANSNCHNNYIGKNYLTGNGTAAYSDAGTGTILGVPDTTNNIDNVT